MRTWAKTRGEMILQDRRPRLSLFLFTQQGVCYPRRNEATIPQTTTLCLQLGLPSVKRSQDLRMSIDVLAWSRSDASKQIS